MQRIVESDYTTRRRTNVRHMMVTARRKDANILYQEPLFAQPLTALGSSFSSRDVTLYNADVLEMYPVWSSPTVIISDGAYGLGLFEGDPIDAKGLGAWYEPHIEAWSRFSTPQTTLWFWNSELGWATIHPILLKQGWKYVSCHIWDKGIAHAAGNSNTQTLRKFPVVTEVCVQYVKEAEIHGESLQKWLRKEWERTGIPLYKANQACDVKNAATRKYLTKDHLWYFPPPEAFEKLVDYANEHGRVSGKPYFSINGQTSLTGKEWGKLRSKFTCPIGVTNVWREPALANVERVKNGSKSVHLNQKPLKLMELIINASSDKGDMVWEPFGGLCSGAIAAYNLKRHCVSAEIQRDYFQLAVRRLRNLE